MMTPMERLCRNRRVTITSTYGGVPTPDGWPAGTHSYKCVLKYKGRQLTAPFHMGPALCREPSAADVLSALIMDAQSVDNARDFYDWCDNYGYDYSQDHGRTWRLCRKLGEKVKRLLGDDFDRFAQAEH